MGFLGIPQGQMDSQCHVLKEDLQQSIGMLAVTSHHARCRGRMQRGVQGGGHLSIALIPDYVMLHGARL